MKTEQMLKTIRDLQKSLIRANKYIAHKVGPPAYPQFGYDSIRKSKSILKAAKANFTRLTDES